MARTRCSYCSIGRGTEPKNEKYCHFCHNSGIIDDNILLFKKSNEKVTWIDGITYNLPNIDSIELHKLQKKVIDPSTVLRQTSIMLLYFISESSTFYGSIQIQKRIKYKIDFNNFKKQYHLYKRSSDVYVSPIFIKP